jgi:hypothetical protein
MAKDRFLVVSGMTGDGLGRPGGEHHRQDHEAQAIPPEERVRHS